MYLTPPVEGVLLGIFLTAVGSEKLE